VELLSHEYNFEARGPIEDARGSYAPSARFARDLSLRQYPGRLDLVGLDGLPASRSFAAPEGFEGHLLFLRHDLLATYAERER